MTALGLERLPRSITDPLDEAVANLLATASEFDALVVRGAASALRAMAHNEREGDRILNDLLDEIGDSWRAAPDRGRLIGLAEALDGVVDALHDLAWFWARRPSHELVDTMLAVRDVARAAGRATQAIELSDASEPRIVRCREAEREARAEIRRARLAACSTIRHGNGDRWPRSPAPR